MGQEVAVTPIQLVTMVSTIANGGVYLPPHILMEQSGHGAAKLHPAPFHPQGELPDPLPEGAHRVISTMTAAQMRKMMQGVMLFGTAKNVAQLNGYTSGGKTGTAQKIDVVTHRYSKTKYIASFVGIAPVNNPAISVAVIIDSPEGSHYGNVNAASGLSRGGAGSTRIPGCAPRYQSHPADRPGEGAACPRAGRSARGAHR